jgi:hypothetical protein
MNKLDFLIVGAAKSGTSSLHYYLCNHPELCMPKNIKELHFWHTHRHETERTITSKSNSIPKTIEEYFSFFEHKKPHQICGEVTPAYLYFYEDTVANLKEYIADYQDIKIIIILREPIDKIWSQYKWSRNMKLDPERLTLPQSLKKEKERLKDTSLSPSLHFVNMSKYYEQVKYYQEHFKQVKVVLYDDLKREPLSVIKEITDFLNISEYKPDNIKQIYNTSRGTTHMNKTVKKMTGLGFGRFIPRKIKDFLLNASYQEEKMSAKTRKQLVAIFKPEINNLNKIIDKDLSPWLKQYK